MAGSGPPSTTSSLKTSMLMLLSSSLLLICRFCDGQNTSWKAVKLSKLQESPLRPSASAVNYFGTMKENMPHFNHVFKNLLIPRPAGSPGNIRVRHFIVLELERLGYDVEVDEFEENTVAGKIKFANVIGTLNPEAPRRLVLACHYDSKASPPNFLGATDSAVPCAQMLNLAHTMFMDLNDSKSADNEITLQLIFFDGEEAFEQWSSSDSIYGARHLAAKLERTPYKLNNEIGQHLDRIDMFVLLDLLGAKNPTIYAYYDETTNWYNRLSLIEDELTRTGVVTGSQIFRGRRNVQIEDDHLPFLKRGVPILHLIPTPFPAVWHTQDDDASAVNADTVEKLNKIFRIFVADYLGLD